MQVDLDQEKRDCWMCKKRSVIHEYGSHKDKDGLYHEGDVIGNKRKQRRII